MFDHDHLDDVREVLASVDREFDELMNVLPFDDLRGVGLARE
jgi:hypothetical protein